MLWVAVPAMIGLLGLVLLWRGLRGRRLDDHPWCRRCRYDLSGAATPSRCPECGAVFFSTRAVRVGRRRRRPWWTAAGLVLLLGAGGLAVQGSHGTEWSSRKPVWLLLLEAEWGDRRATDAALLEIRDRLVKGKLSDRRVSQVTSRALDVQANLKRPWRREWGELVELARFAGKLSDGDWLAYARNAAGFELVLSTPVRRGDPVLRKIVVHERIGPEAGFYLWAAHESCAIDGESVPHDAESFRRTVGCRSCLSRREQPKDHHIMPVVWASGFPRRVIHEALGADVDLEPRRHRFECRWRFSVEEIAPTFSPRGWYDDVSTPPQATHLADWSAVLAADFRVLPADAVTVELVRDESLRQAVRDSIEVRSCTVRSSRRGDWISAIVELVDPPVVCAFDVYWRVGEKRWLIGRSCSNGDGPYGPVQPIARWLRERDVFQGVERIDVVLEPSRDVAVQTFGTRRIWGEPVVISDVPLLRFNPPTRSGG